MQQNDNNQQTYEKYFDELLTKSFFDMHPDIVNFLKNKVLQELTKQIQNPQIPQILVDAIIDSQAKISDTKITQEIAPFSHDIIKVLSNLPTLADKVKVENTVQDFRILIAAVNSPYVLTLPSSQDQNQQKNFSQDQNQQENDAKQIKETKSYIEAKNNLSKKIKSEKAFDYRTERANFQKAVVEELESILQSSAYIDLKSAQEMLLALKKNVIAQLTHSCKNAEQIVQDIEDDPSNYCIEKNSDLKDAFRYLEPQTKENHMQALNSFLESAKFLQFILDTQDRAKELIPKQEAYNGSLKMQMDIVRNSLATGRVFNLESALALTAKTSMTPVQMLRINYELTQLHRIKEMEREKQKKQKEMESVKEITKIEEQKYFENLLIASFFRTHPSLLKSLAKNVIQELEQNNVPNAKKIVDDIIADSNKYDTSKLAGGDKIQGILKDFRESVKFASSAATISKILSTTAKSDLSKIEKLVSLSQDTESIIRDIEQDRRTVGYRTLFESFKKSIGQDRIQWGNDEKNWYQKLITQNHGVEDALQQSRALELQLKEANNRADIFLQQLEKGPQQQKLEKQQQQQQQQQLI